VAHDDLAAQLSLNARSAQKFVGGGVTVTAELDTPDPIVPPSKGKRGT
jgi:hypothetical protein